MPRGVARPAKQVLDVLALREQGASIASIAAQCDLPAGTVSRWCRGLVSADARHLQDDRRIALEPWQLTIVREHPGRLARGLIRADGWRGVNRVRVKGRDYEYPRYQFSSRSDDIRRLFTDALDQLGIEWRPWGRFHISVARRAAVARLDEHVGRKA